RWDRRPAEEQPVARLRLPDTADDASLDMDEGPPGMETLLLLARAMPLPPDVDLAGLLTGLPAQIAPRRAAVWFENGEVVCHEWHRGPKQFDPTVIDDPLLRTQRLIKERLQPHSIYTRAVSFAFGGR